MLPFLPWMYYRMNCYEFGFVIGLKQYYEVNTTYQELYVSCNVQTSLPYEATIFLQIMGLIVFVKQYPDPIPSIFGYHEIFHLFVVMAGE